jgi:hypothetical protein
VYRAGNECVCHRTSSIRTWTVSNVNFRNGPHFIISVESQLPTKSIIVFRTFVLQLLGRSKPKEPSELPVRGDPSDAIQFISFEHPGGTLSSNTPFTEKLELMMRIAGLPYEGYVGIVTHKRYAPKHKVREVSCVSSIRK